jgi:hypothetical protein
MLGHIGLAVLILFVGTLAAALYTFALSLGGMPGFFVTEGATGRSDSGTASVFGLLLTVLGQTYVSLVFVAFVVLSTRSLLGDSSGLGRWLVWAAALWVAGAPTWMALKEAARTEVRTVQHAALTFTAPLSTLGFFLFAFVPKAVSWGWGWVPHF